MQTWHRPPHRASVSVHFFFGDVADRRVAVAIGGAVGIEEDHMHFLPVDDTEYPPVRKNTAMLQLASVLALEQNFEWILKVDDDTYVAVDTLISFVASLPSNTLIFMGQKGTGKPKDRGKMGIIKPFCMGGPGYLFSSMALAMVAPNFDSCVEEADSSDAREFIWHSDVVIGKCVTTWTRLGCWEGKDVSAGEPSMPKYERQFFMQTYNYTTFGWPVWPTYFVTAHPMKTYTLMLSAQIAHEKLTSPFRERRKRHPVERTAHPERGSS